SQGNSVTHSAIVDAFGSDICPVAATNPHTISAKTKPIRSAQIIDRLASIGRKRSAPLRLKQARRETRFPIQGERPSHGTARASSYASLAGLPTRQPASTSAQAAW